MLSRRGFGRCNRADSHAGKKASRKTGMPIQSLALISALRRRRLFFLLFFLFLLRRRSRFRRLVRWRRRWLGCCRRRRALWWPCARRRRRGFRSRLVAVRLGTIRRRLIGLRPRGFGTILLWLWLWRTVRGRLLWRATGLLLRPICLRSRTRSIIWSHWCRPIRLRGWPIHLGRSSWANRL